MIGLIPRSLNTRKKASGLFCIPPHPSHGSEILWKNPHLSSHPSLSKTFNLVIPGLQLSLKCDTSTPLSVLETDLLNRTGPNSWCQYVWSSVSDFQNNTVLPSMTADILEKHPRTRKQDQVISSLL